MRNIRLIATDVDGTLLPEGHSNLNPEYYEVIKRLKDQGIAFAIASGRGTDSIEKLFESVSQDVFFMANNGAELMCNGKYLYQAAFPVELLAQIRDFAPTIGGTFTMVTSSKASYTDSKDEAFIRRLEEGYDAKWVRVEDMLKIPEPIQKFAINTSGDAGAASKVAKEFFAGRAEALCTGAHWVDIIPLGVSKGNTLSRVQDILGAAKEETIAFGDNLNDISMLEQAGRSYAVAEAREKVRQAADIVLGSIYDDAVLGVLKTLII